MNIEQIIIRTAVNPRKKLSDKLIAHYSEVFDNLPPVIVQKGTGVLIDGFHRVAAAKHIGRCDVPADEVDIYDDELFAEACKRNNAHGLALSNDERNEAIVKLYKDGYKQEALGQMWGINKAQVSYIVGAEDRAEKVRPANSNQKLTPKHERIIRRAPKEVQDKVAGVVLTRETKPKDVSKKPKQKRLTVAQTNTLVNEVSKAPERADEILDHLLENPQEDGIVGTDDNGDIDVDDVNKVVAEAKAEPGLLADWSGMMVKIAEFKSKYQVHEVAKALLETKHGLNEINSTVDYFDNLVVEMEVLK